MPSLQISGNLTPSVESANITIPRGSTLGEYHVHLAYKKSFQDTRHSID
jgi:hypothetical protein